MGHITCVRGAGSPVVYIICDLVGKCKGFIKNYDWILVRTIRQCHLARCSGKHPLPVPDSTYQENEK